MTVLSATADKDAVVWKGLLLICSLFLVNVLSTACFIAGSTLGHITGQLFLTPTPAGLVLVPVSTTDEGRVVHGLGRVGSTTAKVLKI